MCMHHVASLAIQSDSPASRTSACVLEDQLSSRVLCVYVHRGASLAETTSLWLKAGYAGGGIMTSVSSR